jgi:hypothetical protein
VECHLSESAYPSPGRSYNWRCISGLEQYSIILQLRSRTARSLALILLPRMVATHAVMQILAARASWFRRPKSDRQPYRGVPVLSVSLSYQPFVPQYTGYWLAAASTMHRRLKQGRRGQYWTSSSTHRNV